jgi:flagellar biosynthetic protein FliP
MTRDELPLSIVVPSFVLSELRTAFQMGFLIFIPFIIVDFIVASSLMSMGMMMMPPVVISMPFKLLLFVLVDGWYLIVQSLVQSFNIA